MSERQIDHDRIERIAQKLDGSVGATAVYAACEAFIRDLMENPIVPTDEQLVILDSVWKRTAVPEVGVDALAVLTRAKMVEWQKVMFLEGKR